jgi:hypothetical protein
MDALCSRRSKGTDAGLLTDRPVPCTLLCKKGLHALQRNDKGVNCARLDKTKSEESGYCFKFFTLNVTFIFKVKFLKMHGVWCTMYSITPEVRREFSP